MVQAQQAQPSQQALQSSPSSSNTAMLPFHSAPAKLTSPTNRVDTLTQQRRFTANDRGGNPNDPSAISQYQNLQSLQCFRCYGFGHMVRDCKYANMQFANVNAPPVHAKFRPTQQQIQEDTQSVSQSNMHRFDNSHLASRAMLMDPTRAAQIRLQQYQQQVSPTQSAATISGGSDDGSEMKVYDKNGLRIKAIQALKHSEDIEDGEIYTMVETIREMRRDPYLKKRKG